MKQKLEKRSIYLKALVDIQMQQVNASKGKPISLEEIIKTGKFVVEDIGVAVQEL